MSLKINSSVVSLMKAYTQPQYNSRTVLTTSVFDYVELWLLRQSKEKSSDARDFWRQSQNFYEAAQILHYESKPLAAYYCCMNAAKALISFRKGDPLNNITHGVSSSRSTDGNFTHKEITYCGSGVLCELSNLIGDSTQKESYKVKDLLYNIPCIHRTYSITFANEPELFIPIFDFTFEQVTGNNKCYARFRVDEDYTHGNALRYIPNKFERISVTQGNDVYYREKKRFKWDIHDTLTLRLKELVSYHKKIRKTFFYIKGEAPTWYVKKDLPNNSRLIDRTSLTLIYGVMHWLSELVRYNPQQFKSYMNGHYNWLLREFVDICLPQFIDEISCELTGCEILSGKFRK